MPQLNFAFFPTQLFWLAVCFVALYWLMSRVALPRVGSVLEEREKRINDNLDKAAQLKAEADAAVASYEKALAEARAKALETLRATQAEFSAKAEARSREINEKLAADIKSGEARIGAAKDKAIAGIREVATDVAQAVVGKLTGMSVDSAKVQAAVESQMGGRR